MDRDPVTRLLYHLMATKLPAREVSVAVYRAASDGEDDLIEMRIPELAALADRLATRLLPPEEQSPGAQAWLAAAPERILQELRSERAESGHGLTLDELATRVGWNVGSEDDTREASAVVQDLYERGLLMRDNAEGRILLTKDGDEALTAGVL